MWRYVIFSVALIGADGSGKTTLANNILKTLPLPVKYLYMGWNPESSNFALPTSRLMLYMKLRSYRKEAERLGIDRPDFISTHHPEHRQVKRGKMGTAARELNRMAEEWYHQLISWIYQQRGYIVLYDRHYYFDAASGSVDTQGETHYRHSRLHAWSLNHMLPKPNLVIFLDAPAEVLYERKKETTLDYLRRRRAVFLEEGKKINNFIQVDATQSEEDVLTEVTQQIIQYHTKYVKKNNVEEIKI